MAKELNEDTGFNISIKTLIAIGFAMATIIGMWFALQADIAEAKELPVPPAPDVTRMEFDMKDQMIRNTIMTTQKDVEEIKEDLDRIEEKIDELRLLGIKMINNEPVTGSDGKRIAFVHPSSCGGVLIELVERTL